MCYANKPGRSPWQVPRRPVSVASGTGADLPFTIFSTARAQSLEFVTRRLKRDENEQPSLAYDFFRFLRRPPSGGQDADITQSIKYLTIPPWHRRHISPQNISSPWLDDAVGYEESSAIFPSTRVCPWPCLHEKCYS